MGNVLNLIALKNVSSIHPPTKLFHLPPDIFCKVWWKKLLRVTPLQPGRGLGFNRLPCSHVPMLWLSQLSHLLAIWRSEVRVSVRLTSLLKVCERNLTSNFVDKMSPKILRRQLGSSITVELKVKIYLALYKLFFGCLAVTDLCVGLILQPLYATYIMSRIMKMNVNVFFYVNKVCAASSYSLCLISAYTSTGISVDRLLALLLGLTYRHVVTLRRARTVMACFWLIAASSAWLRVWRRDVAIKETSVVLILCLVT